MSNESAEATYAAEIAVTETALVAESANVAAGATKISAGATEMAAEAAIVAAGATEIAATETALAAESANVAAGATEVAAGATEIAATRDVPTLTPIPSTPTPSNTATPALIDIPASSINLNVPEEMIRLRDSDKMAMVYVTAGEFIMGSKPGEGDPAEEPQHIVKLDAFWLDSHEVTNAQFAAFLNQAGNQAEGGFTWLKTEDTRIQQLDGTWLIPDPAYTPITRLVV